MSVVMAKQLSMNQGVPSYIPLDRLCLCESCQDDRNQVEDAQAHEAQAQQGAQAQRITRSMARALGQEYQKMALIL